MSQDFLTPPSPAMEPNASSSRTIGPVSIPTNAYITAYALWLFGGFFGFHRFYLRKWFTGVLYLGSFGLFAMGWMIDVFFIPQMLREKFQELRSLREEEGLAVGEEEHEEEALLAPWAAEMSVLDKMSLYVRLSFFLIGPMMVIGIAAMMRQPHIAVLMFVILIATSFLGQMNRLMQRYGGYLDKVPMVREVMSNFQGFFQYYYHNKPRAFLYYLFYPVVGLPSVLFSQKAKEEFKLYTRIIAMIGVALVVEAVFSYGELFPPYLGIGDAVLHVVTQLLVVFFFLLAFLMPTATSAFALSLSGRRKILQRVTVVVVCLCVALSVAVFVQSRERVSVLSSQLLEARMKKPRFREDLRESTEMFLGYHSDKGKTSQEKPVVALPRLTAKYRVLIGALAVRDEANAFSLLAVQGASPGSVWLGVRYDKGNQEYYLLYMMGPNGRFFTSWKALPPAVQRRFKLLRIEPSDDTPTTYPLDEVRAFQMMKELYGADAKRTTSRRRPADPGAPAARRTLAPPSPATDRPRPPRRRKQQNLDDSLGGSDDY